MGKKDGTVEIDCKVIRFSDRAVLINDGTKDIWIPLSQIVDQTGEKYEMTSIFIPEWLAIEKGLV